MVRCSMPDVEDRARAVIPAGLFGLAPGPLTQGDPMTASTESSSVSSIEVLGPLEPGFEEILTDEALAFIEANRDWIERSRAAFARGGRNEGGSNDPRRDCARRWRPRSSRH